MKRPLSQPPPSNDNGGGSWDPLDDYVWDQYEPISVWWEVLVVEVVEVAPWVYDTVIIDPTTWEVSDLSALPKAEQKEIQKKSDVVLKEYEKTQKKSDKIK